MPNLTCPNCGDALPPQIARISMLTCGSCGTTLYLQDETVLNAGESGQMHDAPGLIRLDETVKLGRTSVTILGHARFSYGRGWWDEFWGFDDRDQGCWVSVDEGDIVLQYPLPPAQSPRIQRDPPVGMRFKYAGDDATVIETDRATCLALRGAFDERLQVGEAYDFVNAQLDGGGLLSAEIWPGGERWFLGQWYDPFDLTPGAAP